LIFKDIYVLLRGYNGPDAKSFYRKMEGLCTLPSIAPPTKTALMHLTFGLALDQLHIPLPNQAEGNRLYLGPQLLLERMEAFLALARPKRQNEYLRIEQYRQALQKHLDSSSRPPFFQHSFEADAFATAAELLDRRDELLLNGWDFQQDSDMPGRLSTLAEVEEIIQNTTQLKLSPGFAERWCGILRELTTGNHPIESILCTDPIAVFPPHIQRFFAILTKQQVPISEAPQPENAGDSDLAHFQRRLRSEKTRRSPKADGSLLILRAKRDTDLALTWATTLRKNPDYSPYHLIPDKSRILDNAMVAEGLPSLGIPSNSMARPSIQILKLAHIFLWEPLDPYQLIEFVSLALKPLDDDLAQRIAALIAEQPGTQSDRWRGMLAAFIKDLEDRPAAERDTKLSQYRFWFERSRYDSSSGAPTDEVIRLYQYVYHWARELREEHADHSALAVLAEQARQLVEILNTLPERSLTRLELERLVRTIYEPAPIQFHPLQAGARQPIHHPHALIAPVDDLCWWNFVQYEADYFFSKWYENEQKWLAQRPESVQLETPAQANQRLVRLRKQAILRTQNRLVLILPEIAEGQDVIPHPLFGDLEASFKGLASITVHIDGEEPPRNLGPYLTSPEWPSVPNHPLADPQPFITLPDNRPIPPREKDTITSLESLFYYPYQWVFRHQAKWRPSPILRIVPDRTLLGNLAHRLFEKLFQEQDVITWTRQRVEAWMEQSAAALFEREGSVLLLYGREPTRARFVKQLKYAAWNLIDLLHTNGWSVSGTEVTLEGQMVGNLITGRADLVVERKGEFLVLDLKWRGANYRRQLIRNEEDLQLVLYARLITKDQTWAQSAYYILSTGELIARSNEAFPQLEPVVTDADFIQANQLIFGRMQETYRWRFQQLNKGQVEVRCSDTNDALQEAYEHVPCWIFWK